MKKKVIVLLSTYNGEKFLKKQIDSVLNQKNVDLQLLVRDDGSKDSTLSILDEYQKSGKLKWYKGKNLKPAMSFLDLISNAADSDYYAFCDQDDYWLPDKLERSIKILEGFSSNKPALYCGKPRVVDEELKPLDKTFNWLKVVTFPESFICSAATGCTEVFNKKLFELIRAKHPKKIIMHDDWLLKVCLLFNGNVFFDDDVHILYRQHRDNVVGASVSKMIVVKRQLKNFFTRSQGRSSSMISLYECYADTIDIEKKELLELVVNYKKSFFGRIRLLFSRKIKTRFFVRNVLYRISVLFKAY